MGDDLRMEAIQKGRKELQSYLSRGIRSHASAAVAAILTDILLERLLDKAEGRALLLTALGIGGVHVTTTTLDVVDERP